MENWKTIEGFKAYEVSDLGRVRRRLPGNRTFVGYLLKPTLDKHGYLIVTLRKNKASYNRRVHRLVAGAFLPNPSGLPEVNHKSRKTDNRSTKLEWRSNSGHVQDKVKRNQLGIGVSFKQRPRKWEAYYSPQAGKRKSLGQFDTYVEAKAARDKAVKTLPHIL